jgi:hypothetical protein
MADYEDKKVNDKQFTLFNNESGKSYQIPVMKVKMAQMSGYSKTHQKRQLKN